MKKSKYITLCIVATTALASCNNEQTVSGKKVYMRSDSTAQYTRSHSGGFMYYAFRPYGIFSNGSYHRAGYFSSAIHESSNVGKSGFKQTAVRGGFGRSAFHVSS